MVKTENNKMLEEKMDSYMETTVLLIYSVIAKYIKNMPYKWDNNIIFGEHYNSNLVFKSTIDNFLEVMIKDFIYNNDIEENLEIAIYEKMKEKILFHINNKTKVEISEMFIKINKGAFSSKVETLMDNYTDEDIDNISFILENYIAFLLVDNSSPILHSFQDGQKFSEWRKGDIARKFVQDYLHFSIYVHLGGNIHSPRIYEYVDSVNTTSIFVELVCFEIDDLTKEDFIKRFQNAKNNH